MEYYDSSGRLVTYQLNDLLDNGLTANIYNLNNEICFKEYFSTTRDCLRMNHTLFRILKELNHVATYRLLDPYYSKDKITDLSKLITNPNECEIDAYTYCYIQASEIDIFDIDCEYLIESIILLEDFVEFMSENKIKIYDFKRENIIYTIDKIKLIDLDCCEIDGICYNNDFYTNNRRELINLLLDLFFKNKKYDFNSERMNDYKEKIYELFNIKSSKSIKDAVAKKLVKCKNVTEYLER